ncbi:hypothetical protein BS78_05G148100 [Paspalum vaginatum]|nr:hypothetical protein BS78_05G148100 [Paspalum vaginatum]
MAFAQPIVSGASIKLDPGFRFKPTDEEIMVRYLRPRAMNQPLPSPIIIDADINSHNPWDLVPEGSMEKYFFSQRVPRWPHGNRCNRAGGDGHWRASGKDVPIFCNCINGAAPLMVGLKRTLVFYHGKSGVGENTEWVMQEYSLVGAVLTPYRVMRPNGTNNLGESSRNAEVMTKKIDDMSEADPIATSNMSKISVMVKPDESWVVCRIYKKKRRTRRAIPQCYSTVEGEKVSFIDFLGQGNFEETTSSVSGDFPSENPEDEEEGMSSIIEKAATSGSGK